uniref:Uncharacterized protein n=1 Tax=Lepeophtheirus salmonis TaxID=72036 RepID=A0A0K2V842_LEPSM
MSVLTNLAIFHLDTFSSFLPPFSLRLQKN